jgi:hypothetical protein
MEVSGHPVMPEPCGTNSIRGWVEHTTDLETLKMEAISCFEMLANFYRTTLPYASQDITAHSHCRDNFNPIQDISYSDLSAEGTT